MFRIEVLGHLLSGLRSERSGAGGLRKGLDLLFDFSNYGKFLEDVTRHKKTKIVKHDSLEQYLKKAMYKDHTDLEMEDEESSLAEVSLLKHKIQDDRPVHVGLAILQYSKLRLLEFVSFLEKYLEEGSFKLCYCDTDSLCVATTKTANLTGEESLKEKMSNIFLPIVKSSLKEEFLSKWGEEFVLEETIENSRQPGLMKGKFQFIFLL